MRKPSDDVEDESDKLAGKGYYWSREKSERWQLFMKRLRRRNERVKQENEKYKKKITKEHEEEQAKLLERARARLLENQQQSNIPEEAHAYYYALGLPVGTDMSKVKAKYFHLAKLYHPDKHLNSSEILKRQAEAYFKRISKAYCGLIRVLGG